MSKNKIAVIAFGGNALLPPDSSGTVEEQLSAAEATAGDLISIITSGYRLVIVHGNGPQVGNALIRAEESTNKVPMISLDVCVAQTQGEMGYLLTRGLYNEMHKCSLNFPVTTIVTHCIVDKNDPSIMNPSKPIGPFYAQHRAKELEATKNWNIIADSGRGYRRVVPSPKPISIVEMDLIRHILETTDSILICGGGGGIPSYMENGKLFGIEGVIDKDYTSALIAKELNADLFIIVTQIDRVAINFNTPNQKFLSVINLSELREYQVEGHFPPGSMGPKIRASIDFVEKTGKRVIITKSDLLSSSLAGKTGTQIIPDKKQ